MACRQSGYLLLGLGSTDTIESVLEPTYIGGMRVRISITISQELLKAVDRHTWQQKKTRSDFIETAVWAFIMRLIRDERNARDLEIINRKADFLNREARDVLEYSLR